MYSHKNDILTGMDCSPRMYNLSKYTLLSCISKKNFKNITALSLVNIYAKIVNKIQANWIQRHFNKIIYCEKNYLKNYSFSGKLIYSLMAHQNAFKIKSNSLLLHIRLYKCFLCCCCCFFEVLGIEPRA